MTTLAAAPSRSATTATIALSYGIFIGLGLIAGLVGVAWPSIRTQFGQPQDALAVLLISNMIGYFTSSFTGGLVVRRLGYGRLVIAGLGLMAVGMGLYATLPIWLGLAAAAFLVGYGTGTVDAGLNNYFAQHHSPTAMNWLHTCFGIGATISPLIITATLAFDWAWQVGYAFVAIVCVGLLIGGVLARRLWRTHIVAPNPGGAAHNASTMTSLRVPLVWLCVAVYFVYAGVEATPSVWAFTLFTESRGVDVIAAGSITSLFWASFTIGRLFFSLIIHRFPNTDNLLRGCLAAVIAGSVLLLLARDPIFSSLGLVILGFAQAPLFAVLASNTPRYVGAKHAQNAIGFQVAGAGLGFSLLPSLMGTIGERAGTLEVIPVSVVIAAVLLFILHEIVVRRAASR